MKKLWTPARIKKGFNKFITLHGRLPISSEVDTFTHLPSSRYIQKRFGGLEALRNELGYADTHFGKSENRCRIATQAAERSKVITNDLEELLQTYFDPSCIKKEQTFHGKQRVDFYIQNSEGNFGIDIFYAQTLRTLQSSVNIKMKKYIYFSEPLYLVVANELFLQKELSLYTKNKRIPFPDNIQLITLKTLRSTLKSMRN